MQLHATLCLDARHSVGLVQVFEPFSAAMNDLDGLELPYMGTNMLNY